MSPIREIHLKTIADVLRNLRPGDSEDVVFQRESAEAFIRDIVGLPASEPAGEQRPIGILTTDLDKLSGLIANWAADINERGPARVPAEQGEPHNVGEPRKEWREAILYHLKDYPNLGACEWNCLTMEGFKEVIERIAAARAVPSDAYSVEQINEAAGNLYFALHDAANDAEWGAIIERHLHALFRTKPPTAP